MKGEIVIEQKQLTEILEKLIAKKKSDPQNTEIMEALAENYFRLALLPQTSLNDALRYLFDARRIDSANPRYPYHIARIMYRYGDLEAAGKWLIEAVHLCPTSHRLWAHVAQLMHELNSVYNRKNEYEKEVLQKRSAGLYENIKAGKDTFKEEQLNFTPPLAQAHLEELARKRGQSLDAAVRQSKKSKQSEEEKKEEETPVQRIREAGKCRWPGVLDLEIESLLEDEPSERKRDIIVPRLETAFKNCSQKKAGCTEITILTAQWLITGYPPSSIRRILKDIQMDRDLPGYELLHILLDIFEADVERVPEMIKQALSDNKLPSTLAAIIHKKRVLWLPVVFKTIGPYLAAKKLVDAQKNKTADHETNEKATSLIRTLLDAADKIKLSPPKDMPDVQEKKPIEKITARQACDKLNALLQSAQTLREAVDKSFMMLKSSLAEKVRNISNGEDYARAAKDIEGFHEIIRELNRVAEGLLLTTAMLRGQITSFSANELDQTFFPDVTPEKQYNVFSLKMEECQKAFNETKIPSNIIKVLSKTEIKLKGAAEKNTGMMVPVSAELSGILNDIISALPVPEVNDNIKPGESPYNILDSLISESDEIGKTIETYWTRLKQLVTSEGKDEKLKHEDEVLVNEIRAFIGQLPERCEKTLAQIASLRSSIAPASVEERKINELESAVKGHITVQGKFTRNIDKLPLTQNTNNADSVSDESLKTESFAGIEGLTKAIELVKSGIDDLIKQSLDTFSHYTDQQRLLPSIGMLHLTVLMQSAELLYRMKRKNRAKELWLQCLKIDRLFAPALKNIAVSETTLGCDHAQALLSWKSYGEALYLPAIVSGNPRLFAAERKAFHRDFALAFSQGFFGIEKEQKQEIDVEKPRKLLDFINNPGAINEYIAHKKAELLNLWFEMQTPTLLLGTARSVKGREAREKAIEVLGEMIPPVCKDLPEHIGLPFMKCCMHRLNTAMETCLTLDGLTEKSNPCYRDDEKRITGWIQNIYTIKEQLLFGMSSLKENNKGLKNERFEWENYVKSPDFVFALKKLNEIPVDFISRDLLDSAIGKYGAEGKKNIDHFITSACQLLMIRILKRNDIEFLERIITLLADGDDLNDDLVNAVIVVEDKLSDDQKDRGVETVSAGYDNNNYDTKLGIVIKSIESNRDLWEKVSGKYPVLAGWLDMPGSLNKTVRTDIEKMNQGKLSDQEISKTERILKQWCDKYPQVAGPAFYMGCLLYRANNYEEAGNYFDACIKNAFSEDLVKAAQSYLDHINESVEFKKATEKGDFKSIVESIKNQLNDSPGSITQINSLLSVYQKWIENKPSEALKLIPVIEQDITQVLEKAKSAEDDPEFKSQINELIHNKRQIILGAALKETGQPENADRAKKLKPILKTIVEMDSGNTFALFFLSQCAYQIGAEKWQNTSGREGKQDLNEAVIYAKHIVNADIDENYKDAARNMIEEIEKVV